MLACAQVTFGVMTGPVNARAEFYDGIEVNTDRRWGMSAGVQLSLPIAKHLGLHPELAYRQKGFDELPAKNAPGNPYHYRWTYDYLDLSVMLRYYTGTAPRGVYLGAGPWVGSMLSARVRDMKAGPFSPTAPTVVQSGPVRAIDPNWLGYNTVDMGWCVGAGVNLPLGATWIGAEFRYQQGMANIHNGFTMVDLNWVTGGKLNSRNRCTMVNITWMLPLGSLKEQ